MTPPDQYSSSAAAGSTSAYAAAATRLNARRVIWLRAIAIPVPALLIVAASLVYGTAAPLPQLLVIILALAAVNTWTWYRLKGSRPLSDQEFFLQMVIDVVALTGTLYYSGGAANPFALFFLLPLTITATVLPKRFTWLMAAMTVACYTSLMIVRRPLPQLMTDAGETFFDLHVLGMWLGFVLIALLIAIFVAGMGTALREWDRELARIRERALQDERVLALATQAAGATHELSTPLATMAVLTGELTEDIPRDQFPDAHRQLALLREQIGRCKTALSLLVETAGAGRSESMRPEPLASYLLRVVEQVRSLRSGATVELKLKQPGSGPRIATDRSLDQALTNVLDNAIKASPREVSLVADWDKDTLRLEILDRGPGLSGTTSDGTGLGVGLLITRAIIHQYQGDIQLGPREGGGTRAQLWLPLQRLVVSE